MSENNLNSQKNELSSKNSELQQTLQKLELAQKALIESEKMASLGILSAGVAHEINNPLNFISVSIQNIKAELAEIVEESVTCDKEKLSVINELIDHSETGVERIANIVKSMRSYTHKSDGNLEITNINELIDTSVTILNSKIPSFVRIEHSAKKVPDIQGKQDQLVQVFINILDNAIDAILVNSEEHSGRIEIETSTRKINEVNYVYIGIFNSGNPIKEEILKHLFDPFFTTKAPNKGTGLGLYISYNIIKEHKGIIEVENKLDGVLFKIYLPC